MERRSSSRRDYTSSPTFASLRPPSIRPSSFSPSTPIPGSRRATTTPRQNFSRPGGPLITLVHFLFASSLCSSGCLWLTRRREHPGQQEDTRNRQISTGSSTPQRQPTFPSAPSPSSAQLPSPSLPRDASLPHEPNLIRSSPSKPMTIHLPPSSSLSESSQSSSSRRRSSSFASPLDIPSLPPSVSLDRSNPSSSSLAYRGGSASARVSFSCTSTPPTGRCTRWTSGRRRETSPRRSSSRWDPASPISLISLSI